MTDHLTVELSACRTGRSRLFWSAMQRCFERPTL